MRIRKKWAVLNDALYGGNQRGAGISLQHASQCPGIASLSPQLRELIQCGNQNRDLWRNPGNFPGGLEPVSSRHHDVHHNQIGLKGACAFERFDTIRGFSTHHPAILRLQDFPEQAANGIVIISDQYPQSMSIRIAVNDITSTIIGTRHHRTTKAGGQASDNTAIRVGMMRA